jgi:tRNA-uridine 2-sulfurtransferase
VKTIAVALSGGIDSAFSAYLLRQDGCQVIGVHADFGLSQGASLSHLRKIASLLDIPLEIVDFKESFQKTVMDYFFSEYLVGRTPNPCVVCNQQIKFGLLLDRVLALGADGLATGHYTRIAPCTYGKGLTIARGLDVLKDQSYFLHRLSGPDLERVLFPLGNLTKNQVRARVRELGFPLAPRGESQDICFLPQGDYRKFFLERVNPETIQSGDMVDSEGHKLGTHHGLYAYTVGQRRGLGIPSSAPYYVVRIDPEQNRLVLGRKKDLEATLCSIRDFHWICRPDKFQDLEVLVQVRYRSPAVKARVIRQENRELILQFSKPQKAVTPGQAAVLYAGDLVLGGGWIQEGPPE